MSSPPSPLSPISSTESTTSNEEIEMVTVVKELNTEEFIRFLKRKNLGLEETDYEILRNERISGLAFSTKITVNEFQNIGLPLGPAKILADLSETVKTQKMKSYSSYKTTNDLRKF